MLLYSQNKYKAINKSLLGNRLIKEWSELYKSTTSQNTDWWSSLSDDEKTFYQKKVDSYNKKSKKKGFKVENWKGFSDIKDEAKPYFKEAKRGQATIDGLNKSMTKTMKVTNESGKAFSSVKGKFTDYIDVSKKVIKNGIKGFGKSLLGTGLNMLTNGLAAGAISLGIQGIVKAYDFLAKKQQNVIDKGNEAANTIKDNYSSINSASQWKTDNMERFVELAKGVSSSGYNISLTTEEFSEYQSLASNLATLLPNLVTGFNNLGQPILSVGSNMNSLNKAFRTAELEKYEENIKNTQDVLDAFATQYDETGTQFKKSGLKQQIAAYEDVLDKYHSFSKEDKKKAKESSEWANMKLLDALAYESKDGKDKGYNSKTLDDIAKASGLKDTNHFYENIDAIEEGYQAALKEVQTVADSVKNALPSFLKSRDDYASLIAKNPEFDSFIQSVVSGFDAQTVLDNLGTEEQIRNWSKNVTRGLKNKDVQSAIEGLYTIDEKKANMSFKDYENQLNSFVKTIEDNVKGISAKQVLKSFDLNGAFSDLSQNFKNISQKFGEDFANSLSISDLELATDIISQQDVQNAEQLKQALLEAKQAAFDMNANPIFDSIEEADKTENAGDDYVKATQYLKEAKEMYDNGLYGTDDFKKRAKYLSPTGSEDPANFIENYGKAARYLTEDGSGVSNFLNDLNKKGYATFENLSDGTKKWSYNIQDLQKAAQDMGMGFEFFMDMFGRLEDYGFSNNFITSQEDGIEKITDKTTKLAQAKKELAEMETTGQYTTVDENGNEQKTVANQTAIDAKKAEIAGLENDLNELQNSLDQYNQATADSINQQIEKSKQMYSSLKEERDKILAENRYGENTDEVVRGLDEQLKQIAQDGFFEIDGEMNIVNEDEVKSEIESEPVKIDAEIDLEKLKSANEHLKELGETDVTFNFETDNFQNLAAQVESATKLVEQFQNEDGVVDLSVNGAQEAVNILSALVIKKQEAAQPVVMSVDTGKLDGDLAAVIGKLQEFQTAYNELERLNTLKAAGVNVDTSEAQTKLNNITSEIQSLDGKQAEIMAKVVPDTSSVEAISSTLSSMNPEMLVKVGVNPEAITNYNPEDKEANVNFHVEDSEIKSYTPPNKNASVKYLPDTSSLPTSFTPLTRTVNYVKGSDAESSGTMLSPARANGTAYNTLNMSPAHAGGNVSLPKDEKALVNEVGIESIVRDGVWKLLPGGAHFEQLKKGDIIFNASQTEQLLKHGSISGHGKAYADGSVGNVRDLVRTPLSAYAGGFGGGVLGAGGSGSQANFGGGNSNKGNSNKATNTANQISKNTKKTADTVKDISNELSNYEDWVERRFKAIESEFAHLEAVFERITHLPDKLAKAYELLAKNKDYMNTVNDSKATYQSHLDKIKGQGLSQDIIDKIEMGSLEISSYSEETQKLISEYETYYNKLRDCTAQYDELLAKQSELVESTLDSVSDYYEMINNVDEASKAVFEAQRELYENLGISVTSKSQSDSLNKSIAEQEKITNRLTAQIEAYKAQIDTLVSSGYMEVNSKEYFAAHEALNQMNKELAESKSALIEFQDQLYELEYTGIQNIIDRFEQAVDKLDAKISYIKSKDEKVSENLYQEQINANNSQIREKMQLKAKKEKEQSLYEVGSTRYQELAEEINNLDKETYELLTTNEELKDSIFELRFADLEEGIKGYQDLRNEIEDFKSLLNEEAFFDKGGSITEDGLANLALLQQQMASAKQEIADYRTGLDKLQESFDNGVISETEYNEKSAEYREGIRNSIKDIKDYEDSLTDLYMTQMSKENEALQKTIDQYAEARKRKASYFEYDKKLKGQQKSVDMLKAQIAALEGVKIFALCVLIAGTPLEFYKLQRKNEICLSVNV